MAPSLAPPMTPSLDATPSKRSRRMLPIVPAIPRSLEKRKTKDDLKSSKDGREAGGPIRPTSPEGRAELQVETAAAESKSAFQSTFIRTNEQKPTTSSADSCKVSSVHAQDFGIEKHGFRLPPAFYPKRSPPPAISTGFSSADENAIASEETSQTLEEDDGGNMSQQSPPENRVTLNAAAPTFHSHPTPPTDITTSPTESSYQGYDLAQSAHNQQEPTPPTDDALSPIPQSYQTYEGSQNISFYAPPQSSDDTSSPNHSFYQGYAYAAASYGYSPQSLASLASQHPVNSPHCTEAHTSYEQRYESQASCYGNQSPYPVLGSQPPLTPSRTPLDPSVQPWSYSNGPPLTMPISYGSMHSYDPQSAIEARVRSTSQGTLQSEKSAQKNDFIDDRSQPVLINASENKTAQLIRNAWRTLNDCMSSHVPLVEHLLHQFNVEEYADCQLTLVHENLRFKKTTWSLSSLLLAQSHKLRDLLKSAGLSEDGKTCLEIRLTDRFVTPWAMNSALRILYGERLEMFTLAIIHSAFDHDAEAWVFHMDACLALAAAGHVLGLDNVVSYALQTASSILEWDNLEHALSFGLESRPNRGTSASVDVIPLSSYSPVWSRKSDPSSTLNLTPPSSSSESRPERSGQSGSRYEGVSSVGSDMEVRSAFDLQMRCLQWMASNLDDSWHFDPSARPLAEVDRLPTTAESRSPLFKSRLSRIQFGDHPSEMHAKASDRNFLVSSIVLSLPFVALKYMLDAGTQPISRQIHAIVQERERRRQIVLQSKSVPWSQRLAARELEWAEVGYTERVETTGGGQVTLARKFTGIDRQVSEPGTPDLPKS